MQQLADCTNSLNLEPNQERVLSDRGFIYLKLGELDRSIADFDAALTINPKLAFSYYGRGLARRGTGDNLAAGKDFEMARTIRPGVAKVVATEYGLQ